MIHDQLVRVDIFNNGTEATNATNASLTDTWGRGSATNATAGYGEHWATVDAMMTPATATNSSAKWTALQLEHGTTTDASNFTSISGAVGTTNATASATQFVLPVHNNTSYMGVVRFTVNLSDKERYLRLIAHAPASHNTQVSVARYYRRQESNVGPHTAGPYDAATAC